MVSDRGRIFSHNRSKWFEVRVFYPSRIWFLLQLLKICYIFYYLFKRKVQDAGYEAIPVILKNERTGQFDIWTRWLAINLLQFFWHAFFNLMISGKAIMCYFSYFDLTTFCNNCWNCNCKLCPQSHFLKIKFSSGKYLGRWKALQGEPYICQVKIQANSILAFMNCSFIKSVTFVIIHVTPPWT